MALTYSQYVGDGSTRLFAVTFPYISKSHVKVRVDGATVPFAWSTPSLVQFVLAPAAGAVIDVRRETPNTEPLVDFHDGSTLVESDLDLATIQSLYIAQELTDSLDAKIGADNDGAINAANRRVKNIAAPTSANDAVNKSYVDEALAAVPAQVSTAQAAAVDSAASADNSQAQAGIAKAQADIATAKAAEAAASAALAAIIDPANLYIKTDFKSDGSPNAPMMTDAGGTIAVQMLRVTGSSETQRRIEFWNSTELRWVVYRDTDDSFSLWGTGLGTVLRVDPTTHETTFTVSPVAPTPPEGDASFKLATTAWVWQLIQAAGAEVGSILFYPSTKTPRGAYIAGNGAAVDRTVYSKLDAAMYVGDAENATAPCWYRCTNPASPSTTRSTVGQYFVLPDLRGVFPRFLDDGKGYDPGRAINTYQADELKSHAHYLPEGGNDSGGGVYGKLTGRNVSTTATGGSETRPKNFAVRGWIKY